MPLMSTRKEVAAQAGVSTTTVTNVVNGRGNVGEEVRARVLEAIRKLDYRPHPVARALALRSSKQLAIVCHLLSNPFFGQLFQDLTEQLHAAGFKSIALNGALVDLDYILEDLHGQIDGIFVLDGSLSLGAVKTLLHKGVPVVGQGYESRKEIPSVEPDFGAGMDQAVEHLVNLGHTRIAFVTSQPVDEYNLRYVEYCRALARRNIPLDAALIVSGTPPHVATPAAGYRVTVELLERNVDATAIIAYSDLVAFGAFRALREAGLRIPNDVSLIGWDNIMIAQYMDPPLTTVHTSTDALAKAFLGSLNRQINGEKPETPMRVETKLVVRQSSGIAPRYNPYHLVNHG